MVTRTCSSCSRDLQKSEYSKKQWSKKAAASKCKTCVEGGEINPAPIKDETPVNADTAVANEVVDVDTKAEEEAKEAADEKAKKEAEEAE